METRVALERESQVCSVRRKGALIIGQLRLGRERKARGEIFERRDVKTNASLLKFARVESVRRNQFRYERAELFELAGFDGRAVAYGQGRASLFDPARVSYRDLLTVFWEDHDPTQGMRQGNDVGTQYRSAVFVHSDAQREAAEASEDAYQGAVTAAGYGPITTEITAAADFYFAEDYHQQYLDKNPNGYCGLGGTGVACPVGIVKSESRD